MGRSLPGELRESLAAYKRLLERAFGRRLRSVQLFGSQARGDADIESDADVLVVIDDDLRDVERGEAIDLAFRAWRDMGCRGPLISPVVWSSAEREMRRRLERRIALDIDREGLSL